MIDPTEPGPLTPDAPVVGKLKGEEVTLYGEETPPASRSRREGLIDAVKRHFARHDFALLTLARG